MVKEAAEFVSAQHTEMKANNNSNPQKLLVHCKAGIGRTGTTISLINSVIAIEEQKANG